MKMAREELRCFWCWCKMAPVPVQKITLNSLAHLAIWCLDSNCMFLDFTAWLSILLVQNSYILQVFWGGIIPMIQAIDQVLLCYYSCGLVDLQVFHFSSLSPCWQLRSGKVFESSPWTGTSKYTAFSVATFLLLKCLAHSLLILKVQTLWEVTRVSIRMDFSFVSCDAVTAICVLMWSEVAYPTTLNHFILYHNLLFYLQEVRKFIT